MRFLRTTPLPRLLAILAGVVAIGVGGAAIATAGSEGPKPPAKPLAEALHDAAVAPAVEGLTARITFTNHLIDASSFQGSDPLLAGATGRLWFGAGHRFRLELQSDAGDAQIVSDGTTVTLYDAAMHTAYEADLPEHQQDAESGDGPPTIASIQQDLTRLMKHASVSGAIPDNVAGQPAYRVELAPLRDGGLLGKVRLAWDAAHGVPLRAAVYARGDSSPVLELKATEISYGSVPASTFDVRPPPDAKLTTLTRHRSPAKQGASEPKPVTGVAAVAKALSFDLAAPDSLAGLPRSEVRLIDVKGEPGALVSYGRGLGAIVVLEQRNDGSDPAIAEPKGEQPGLSLPTVSIGGATGQKLETALGTLIRFTRAGVDYTVAGSVPAAVAETAARGL
jgi:outer membrane lipoprotein-sorting protein